MANIRLVVLLNKKTQKNENAKRSNFEESSTGAFTSYDVSMIPTEFLLRMELSINHLMSQLYRLDFHGQLRSH